MKRYQFTFMMNRIQMVCGISEYTMYGGHYNMYIHINFRLLLIFKVGNSKRMEEVHNVRKRLISI